MSRRRSNGCYRCHAEGQTVVGSCSLFTTSPAVSPGRSGNSDNSGWVIRVSKMLPEIDPKKQYPKFWVPVSGFPEIPDQLLNHCLSHLATSKKEG